METSLLLQTDGARYIADSIRKGTTFAAGKIGTSELNCLCFYMAHRRAEIKLPYPSLIMTHMTVNAGLFPATQETLDIWARHMMTSVLPAMDIIVEWSSSGNERLILNMTNPRSKRIRLRSLEPYYESDTRDRWTTAIPEGSCVAVISPFSKSIHGQWKRRGQVWPTNTMWPKDMTLCPVQCAYAPTLTTDLQTAWSEEIVVGGWMAAVISIVNQVKAAKATLAIIGCGALSLPIAIALKKQGIAAIHMGGATQILFGIKGGRWLDHTVISTFFNDSWVFPGADEIPTGASVVENGCYW